MKGPAVRGLRAFTLAAVLLLVLPHPAAADWQFTPFLGYTFKGATTLVDLVDNETAADDTQWHFGGAVTLIGESPLGIEAYYVRTPGFFQRGEGTIGATRVTSSRTYAFMGNVVLATPRRWNEGGLRPFVSGGLGLMHASANDQLNILPFTVDLLAMNVGGGAVGLLSERVGLRFDLRYFRNVRGVNLDELEVPFTLGQPLRLRYWTTSIGVVIRY